MHSKATKKSESRKHQDVEDKIKEIKIRHQNWMKQDSEIVSQGLKEDTIKSAAAKKVFRLPASTRSSENLIPGNDSKQSKGFSAWLENRAQSSNFSTSACDTDSTALDLSSTPEDNIDETEEIEAVADRIVARVKHEIQNAALEGLVQQPSQVFSGLGFGERTNTQVLGKSRNKHPENHYCRVCHQLMLPPTFAPVLLVPCGDTACSKCTKQSDQCPICQSSVRSRTCNIMLQQIVEQYRSDVLPSSSLKKHGSKNERKDEIEEYNNLKLRYEILDEEQSAILQKIERLDQDKQSEQRQIEHIEKQQQHLEDQIEELRERQHILETHKTAYIENCNDIEVKKKDERRKLSLLQTTLAELRNKLKQMKHSIPKSLDS